MALTIIKPGQSISVKGLRALFYGEPSIGKTTLSYSFSRPICIDFDKGAHRSEFGEHVTRIQLDTWEDILQLTKETNNYADYDTIVVDTASKIQECIITSIIKNNPKMGTRNGNLTLNGYSEMAAVFKIWVNKIIELGKDFVILAQFTEEKDGDNIRKRPKYQGKASAGIIMEDTDLMGFMHYEGDKRIISFNLSEDYFAKDPARIGRYVIPELDPNVKVKPTYGAEILARTKATINQRFAASAEIVNKLIEWEDTISGFTSAAEFNNVLNTVKGLQQPLLGQVKTAMNNRRNELGIGFENGLFTDPPASAPVQQEPAQPITQPPAANAAQFPSQEPPVETAPAQVQQETLQPAPATADEMNF